MSLFKRIARKMPSGLIRWVGKLQFKIPILGGLIRRLAAHAASGEGIIREGVGKGLHFDATGGYFGYLAGTSEPEEQALLAKYLKQGDVFYDLGANVGFYVILAARLIGEKGHVYAFEPFPESIQAIKRNTSLNQFTNVTVVEAAVSDKAGTASFASDEISAKNRITNTGEQRNGVEVKLIALDQWIKETGARPPSLIMIDIEGAEIDALRGMQQLLSQYRPVVLCEVHWLGQPMLDYCKQVWEPMGYKITTYSGDPLPQEGTPRYHICAVPTAQTTGNTGTGINRINTATV